MQKKYSETLVHWIANISLISLTVGLLGIWEAALYLSHSLWPGFNLDQFIDRLIAGAGIFRGFVMIGAPIVMFVALTSVAILGIYIAVWLESLLIFIAIRGYLRRVYTAEEVMQAYAKVCRLQGGAPPNVMMAATLKKWNWYGKSVNWEDAHFRKIVYSAYKQ